MDKKHFKYTTLSLILINIWTLYFFFDYYNANLKYSMGSLTLFFNFLDFVCYATGAGFLLILLRVTFFRNKNKLKFKHNFFYILTGIFNLYFSIIWIISIIMNYIKFNLEYTAGNIIVAIFILVDIYAFKEKANNTDLQTH